jgi:thiamine-phosphate pyrophosphorylase
MLVADRGFFGGDEAWLEALDRVAAAIMVVSDAKAAETMAAKNGVHPAADGVSPTGRWPGILIQLRVKELAVQSREQLVSAGLVRARAAGVPVLLNGTEAEARRLGFDGVHWPEISIPARRGPPAAAAARLVRSAAVHSAVAVGRAEAAGADLVVFGPVFTSGTKAGVGTAALAEVVRRSNLPVLAIGGIDAARVAACLAAGAAGVAVVSAVFAAAVDPRATLRDLCGALATPAARA